MRSWVYLFALLAPTVCGLRRHVCEPRIRALLWAGHSAAEGGAASAEQRREAGLLHQHLQCLGHPRVLAPGGSHQHVAKIQGRITHWNEWLGQSSLNRRISGITLKLFLSHSVVLQLCELPDWRRSVHITGHWERCSEREQKRRCTASKALLQHRPPATGSQTFYVFSVNS